MLPLRTLAGTVQRTFRVMTSSFAVSRHCNLHTLIPPIASIRDPCLSLKTTISQDSLLNVPSSNITFTRNYQVRVAIRRRCQYCYFVKRNGLLYVECTAKPRHKQMQKISKHKMYRDDYTEGKWKMMVYSKYREDRWYRQADPSYVNYNWLGDRFCTEV